MAFETICQKTFSNLLSSFKLGKALAELQTRAKQVEQDPKDQVARRQLQQTAEKVAQRKFSNPQVLTTIANAQMILGEQDKAEANVDKALSANPKLPAAQQLKQK